MSIGTHLLVISGKSYLDIVNHTYSLEKFSREAQVGSNQTGMIYRLRLLMDTIVSALYLL